MRFDDLVVWHPYPAEKPKTSGKYLITKVSAESSDPYVMYGIYYSVRHDMWNWFDLLDPAERTDEDAFTPYTIAWAEMPEVTPYAG